MSGAGASPGPAADDGGVGPSREAIEAVLRAAIDPIARLEIVNESAAHAGHVGASARTHWRVRIVAAAFAGRPPVARHRLVYDALRPLFDQGLHALAIEARAPGPTD